MATPIPRISNVQNFRILLFCVPVMDELIHEVYTGCAHPNGSTINILFFSFRHHAENVFFGGAETAEEF